MLLPRTNHSKQGRQRTSTAACVEQVVMRKDRLALLLDDIALLHGLGARLVLVCGAKPQIDDYLRSHGQPPVHVGAYRVTDALALKGALKVAGATCTEISAHLSKVCCGRADRRAKAREWARAWMEGGNGCVFRWLGGYSLRLAWEPAGGSNRRPSRSRLRLRSRRPHPRSHSPRPAAGAFHPHGAPPRSR